MGGRQRLGEEDSRVFCFRVSGEEFTRLEKAAEESDVNMATLMRFFLRRGLYGRAAEKREVRMREKGIPHGGSKTVRSDVAAVPDSIFEQASAPETGVVSEPAASVGPGGGFVFRGIEHDARCPCGMCAAEREKSVARKTQTV